VEELLRKGAYGAVMDENNEDSKFSEEDIDTILQRRTQTVTIQAGVKGSTFAKASFNVSSNREDIDVNDPNFWAKWAKRAGVDPDFNPDKELILYEPRQRKRRFDEEVYKNREEEDSDSDSDDSHKLGKKRMSKRRRGADGDATYTPDELAFNKTDYFKVEKNLGVFGWGRWKEIRAICDFKQPLTDEDIEHMCRTLLLHCVREFSGDEKIREFIWELVTPLDAEIVQPDTAAQRRKKTPAKSGSRKSSRIHNKDEEEDNDLNSIYHQGWAALPAYNPPALAVDCSSQRHLQRHANKSVSLVLFLSTAKLYVFACRSAIERDI
jgi:chromodomain-helicase-DNA-binding protein 7